MEAALKESGIREGLLLVNAMHITASVFINDDESGLHADFEQWLERMGIMENGRLTSRAGDPTLFTARR